MRNDGRTAPKRCYSNACQIVLSGKVKDAKYVLCWVEDAAGGTHGHAVFEAEGHYFDPTLQANSGISKSYTHVQTFTREQLDALLTNKFGADYSVQGFAPPALLPNGRVSCEEVSN